MRHDVECSCGPVATETIWENVTMNQNVRQILEFKAVIEYLNYLNCLNSHIICKKSYCNADIDVC